jgi:hypothetical protein
MSRHDVICLHTMVGTLAGTEAFFRRVQLESHFGVGHDGEVRQWQDLELVARSNAAGNRRLISIETADRGPGFPDWDTRRDDVPAWTAAQLDSLTELVAWLCERFDIPRVLIPDSRPSRRGVGYHRQGIRGHSDGLVPGGEVWSGAAGKVCPGNRRIAQLPTIIARADAPPTRSSVPQEAATMRYVNLTNDDGSTPTRSAMLTVDPVGRSIVMPTGARVWVQWSAFLPDGGTARVDWLVVTFPGRVQTIDPFDLRHRATGAIELGAGANGVEIRVSGIPRGAAIGFHLDGINHA